nr:hypothetical protein [uncultured Sphingomonas sp.]
MPRGILFLIVLILLLVGGTWFLSRHASEQPKQAIESEVTANAATK